MRVLYSFGNRSSCNVILERLKVDCEMYVSGYEVGSYGVEHIDYSLEGMYNDLSGCDRVKLVNFFGGGMVPMMSYERCVEMYEELELLELDLVICDYEPMMSNMAKKLGVELWYVSGVHLYDGVKWGYGVRRYDSRLDAIRKQLSFLPESSRRYIHSGLGMLEGLEKKEGYEWLRPEGIRSVYLGRRGGVGLFSEESRLEELGRMLRCLPPYEMKLGYEEEEEESCEGGGWLLCGGEGNYIMDGLLSGVRRIDVSPSLEDPEGMANACLLRKLGLGEDLGKLEYMERYGLEELERVRDMEVESYELKNNYNSLREELEEYEKVINR